MEPVFLSRVEAVFAISGRGVVIHPGVPSGPYRVFIGDDLEIRTPDGSRRFTKVSGLELGGNSAGKCCPIVLPHDINQEDVPVGAELWQVSRSCPPTEET